MATGSAVNPRPTTAGGRPPDHKMWAHSGDSHLLEPEGLWRLLLPATLAARMPRTERVSDDEEVLIIDGEATRRPVPKFMTRRGSDGLTIAERNTRAPGARDVGLRVQDLTDEGIWAEVIYAPAALSPGLLRDRALARAASHALNEWIATEVQGRCPDRLVPTGMLPLADTDDAVDELEHCAELGLHVVWMPTGVPEGAEDYPDGTWEPFWAAAERAGMVLGFHIGTEGDDPAARYRGAGGAVLNYVETSYGGQRTATKLVASGVLDRHPGLPLQPPLLALVLRLQMMLRQSLLQNCKRVLRRIRKLK